MLTLIYFASLREALGIATEQVSLTPDIHTVADLVRNLTAERVALTDERLLVAVNQEMVDRNHPVCDGDEVAFFPPVTGG